MSQPDVPPLFDRVPAGLFRALGAENRRRYWDVLARLLEELWGEGGRSPGEETQRGVVVRTVESLLAADDPWEEDLDTPVGIRAHGLVNLFVETGWLAQRRRGLVEMVTIRPVVAQFYTVLSEFALHEPEFLGSKVRSIYLNLRAIAAGEASGDQYAEAAKQSKRCMAHIANTGCRVQDLMEALLKRTVLPGAPSAGVVQDLMEALLKRTTAREFVSGFFDDYIQKVFIADYSELRTRDHPLQHRSAIIALTLQFQHDETKREALLRWYQEKVAGGDRVKAELQYERDTRQLMRLREVDEQLQRLDEEIRDANQRAMTFLEYKLRAPKHLDKLIARALHATNAMEEGAIALPAAPDRRHISEWGLAKPRMLARQATATAVERTPPTLDELAMEALRRRMAENRMVKPVHLANYVVRHLGDKRAVSSDELSITSINDLCCYQRLLLIASRSDCPPAMRRSDPMLQMLKRVQLTFDDDGITRNGYMEHRRFTIQREYA